MPKDVCDLSQKELNEKIAHLKELSIKNPTDVDIMMQLSSCYRHKDNYDKALVIHDKIIETDPNNPDFLFMKGLLLIEAAREDEALAIFDKLLEHEPTSRDLLFNKGLALKRLGRTEESKEVMKKAMKPS